MIQIEKLSSISRNNKGPHDAGHKFIMEAHAYHGFYSAHGAHQRSSFDFEHKKLKSDISSKLKLRT